MDFFSFISFYSTFVDNGFKSFVHEIHERINLFFCVSLWIFVVSVLNFKTETTKIHQKTQTNAKAEEPERTFNPGSIIDEFFILYINRS